MNEFEFENLFRDIFYNSYEFIFEDIDYYEEKIPQIRNIKVNQEITFMESLEGCQKTISFKRLTYCKSCQGTKKKQTARPIKCKKCNGKGEIFVKNGVYTYSLLCDFCDGNGSVNQSNCKQCSGKGTFNTDVTENIKIPKCSEDNFKLKIQNKVILIIKLFRVIKFLMENMEIYLLKLKLNHILILKGITLIFILLIILLFLKLFLEEILMLRRFMVI